MSCERETRAILIGALHVIAVAVTYLIPYRVLAPHASVASTVVYIGRTLHAVLGGYDDLAAATVPHMRVSLAPCLVGGAAAMTWSVMDAVYGQWWTYWVVTRVVLARIVYGIVVDAALLSVLEGYAGHPISALSNRAGTPSDAPPIPHSPAPPAASPACPAQT